MGLWDPSLEIPAFPTLPESSQPYTTGRTLGVGEPSPEQAQCGLADPALYHCGTLPVHRAGLVGAGSAQLGRAEGRARGAEGKAQRQRAGLP